MINDDENPYAPVRRALVEYRRQGTPFADAWPVAVKELPPAYRPTLLDTVAAWEAAYEGQPPTRRERGVSALRAALDDLLAEEPAARADGELVA